MLVGHPIRTNERCYVRIHLAHNECIDIEKLTHSLQREIARYTTIDKLEVSFQLRHVIGLDFTRLSFDHKFDAIETGWDSATGDGCGPNDDIWSCQIVKQLGITLPDAICHCDV
jgi:hypothetical protein